MPQNNLKTSHGKTLADQKAKDVLDDVVAVLDHIDSQKSSVMEFTEEELKILQAFRAHHVQQGKYLPLGALDKLRDHSKTDGQDNPFEASLHHLVEMSFITRDPIGYALTEKGYAFISS